MSAERGPRDGPRASVVIATYQRESLLPRLVRALEAQSVPATEFEVIFVDDGSRDRTHELLAELAGASPLDIRVLGDGVNRRQAAARNIGWRAARAPIVAFTDDDCVPAPTWLAEGLAAMGDAHRVVVGHTIPDPDQEHLQGPFSRSITVAHADYFETCNVFYRRRDLEEVDGFDEAFTSHGGEDTDLGWRVRDRGAEPVFVPAALVLHDVKPSDVRAATREALRWTGIPRVVRLHPDARRFLFGKVFWKPSHPLALGALAGVATAWRHPAALALAVPWLWYRVKVQPLSQGPRQRWVVLPGALAIDLAEVAAMISGSIRARTFVL